MAISVFIILDTVRVSGVAAYARPRNAGKPGNRPFPAFGKPLALLHTAEPAPVELWSNDRPRAGRRPGSVKDNRQHPGTAEFPGQPAREARS